TYSPRRRCVVNRSERDRELLAFIQECVDKIGEYTKGGLQRPSSDSMAEDALLRRLETLADAAGQLSEVLMARHADIPWRKIVGFRDVLAHGYLGVDQDLVWGVVTRDLPPLKTVIDEELGPEL